MDERSAAELLAFVRNVAERDCCKPCWDRARELLTQIEARKARR